MTPLKGAAQLSRRKDLWNYSTIDSLCEDWRHLDSLTDNYFNSGWSSLSHSSRLLMPVLWDRIPVFSESVSRVVLVTDEPNWCVHWSLQFSAWRWSQIISAFYFHSIISSSLGPNPDLASPTVADLDKSRHWPGLGHALFTFISYWFFSLVDFFLALTFGEGSHCI